MRHILTIFILIFTVMFSSTSFGGWMKVSESNRGSNFFMDFQNIKKHGGAVFFWSLQSERKPDRFGNMSNKTYFKVNCSTMGAVMLTGYYYTKPMGRGRHYSKDYPNDEWRYPPQIHLLTQ